MLRHLLAFLIALLLSCSAYSQYPGAAGCIGFNGSSQYVTVADAATLNNATALTLEAWVLPNGFAANTYGNVIIGKDGWASGPQGYTLRCGGNGALSFNIGTGSGWAEVVASNVLQTQVWQHVAGVFDGSTLRIYVNGVLVGTTNYTGTISTGTYPLNLGRIPYTVQGGRFFQGELDEIRVWRSALSITRLREWMCKKVTSSHPDYSSLGGYWRFDTGTGTVLSDFSPNGNNGTLMGGPIWGLSGASIGDQSVFSYSFPAILSIPGVSGGILGIDNVSGSPDGVQLYMVSEAPDLVNLPPGFTSFDTTNYYGVMVIGGTSPNFDLTVNYTTNPYIGPNDGCIAAIAGRLANNFSNWYAISATHQLAQNQLFRATIGQQQFILGRQPQPYPLTALGHVNFCPGDTAYLATTLASNLTYTWYQNGNLIPGATTAGYYATQTGGYHVVVDDGTCAYNSDTVQVSVYPVPTLTQTPLGNVCTNDGLLSLSATPPGGTFNGSGVSGNTFDPIAAGVGTANIVYTYTDSNMCVIVDTQVVTVNPAPQVGFTSPADVCDNAYPFTLNNGTPGGGTYTGQGVSGGSTFTPSGLAPGSYPLQYTFTDANGCTDSATAMITVLASPPTPTISVGGNTLYSSVASGNQWYLNGNPIPGATGNTYVPTVTGLYTVVATGTNGCVSDTAIGLTYVGIETALISSFQVWPVPAGESVRAEWQASPGEEYDLELVDLLGKLLLRESGNAIGVGLQTHEIDLGTLDSGIYFLRLKTPEGQGIKKILRK